MRVSIACVAPTLSQAERPAAYGGVELSSRGCAGVSQLERASFPLDWLAAYPNCVEVKSREDGATNGSWPWLDGLERHERSSHHGRLFALACSCVFIS
jgi:hypothetical protein